MLFGLFICAVRARWRCCPRTCASSSASAWASCTWCWRPVILFQQRRRLKPLVRDGLVVPVDELFHEDGRPTRQDRDRARRTRRPGRRRRASSTGNAVLPRRAARPASSLVLGVAWSRRSSTTTSTLRRQRLDLPALRRRPVGYALGGFGGRAAGTRRRAHQRHPRRRRRVRALDPGPHRHLARARRGPRALQRPLPGLRPGQIFGHLVIAAALGMLGGWLGARPAVATRRQSTRRSPTGRTAP